MASPSGGGKTTLIRRVMQELSAEGREAHFSISHTTRAPRACERDGVDYYFVDRPAFQAMAARGEFLEFAEVHGNLYGTSRAEVEGRLERGCQDSDAAIALRIKNAVQEMREYAEFDYVIINDRLEDATRALASIVAAARMRPFRVRARVQMILDGFERAVKKEE